MASSPGPFLLHHMWNEHMLPGVDRTEYPVKKAYGEEWEVFLPDRPFVVPSAYQLARLREKEQYHEVSAEWMNNPDQPIDNRLLVRLRIWILTNGTISAELFDRLVVPYDNGFYKKSDGKSTPLWWMKVSRLQKRLGVKKDIVAVRHDYDYYRISPDQRSADQHYLHSQLALGQTRALPYMEYYALRLFGWNARTRHAWETLYTPGYGTDEYIHKLPNRR